METDISLGPIRFTRAVSVGFVSLGFVCAGVTNYLLYLTERQEVMPTLLTTLSFWVMVVSGIWLFHGLGEEFESVLNRLVNRRALRMTDDQLEQFKSDVQAKSQRAAMVGGFLLLGLMVAFYVSAYVSSDDKPDVAAVIQYFFEAGANFLVGMYMGRTAVQAFFGMLLRKRRFDLAIMPGHPDGAAGMSPIGDLFLKQAAVMLLPAAYFVIWWFLMTGKSASDSGVFGTERWKEFSDQFAGVYFAFFLVMMCIQFVAFFAPMWTFHQEMKAQKATELVIADQLSDRINEIKAQIPNEQDETELRILKDRLADLQERHREIEALPIWPVSMAIRRKFAINNALVLLPVFITIWDIVTRIRG